MDWNKVTIEEKVTYLDWSHEFYSDLIQYAEMLLKDMDKDDEKYIHWQSVLNHARHELEVVNIQIDEKEELEAGTPFWAL